jgi:hypothetical protein
MDGRISLEKKATNEGHQINELWHYKHVEKRTNSNMDAKENMNHINMQKKI